MFKTTYIHHHLGLGDHIVCNGLVRNLMKGAEGPIELACKHHNAGSVRQLYRDSNIIIDPIATDSEAVSHYDEKDVIRIGFGNCSGDWEKSFYGQYKVPYRKRYDDFYIDRDYDREKKLLEKLNLPEKYTFVCVTGSIAIPWAGPLEIKTDNEIVELEPLTDSIFDWIPVILNAEEIHTIDSSVFHLIKQLSVEKPKIFYDVRSGLPRQKSPTFEDQNWEIKKL